MVIITEYQSCNWVSFMGLVVMETANEIIILKKEMELE